MHRGEVAGADHHVGLGRHRDQLGRLSEVAVQVAESEQFHRPGNLAGVVRGRSRAGSSFGFDNLAALMPDVFWIGVVLAGAIFLISVISSMRSRTTSVATGAAMGVYLGIMLAFPLLAIGLASS